MADHETDRNTRIVLAARPQGEPTADDFRLEHAPLPEPAEGQVLLRNRYLSLDPYMRGRMNAGRSYAKPVEIGEVMDGGTVSEVIASRHPDLHVGDMVLAHGGWQTHVVADGRLLKRRLDARAAPLTTALGVYGMPGFTAYVGVLHIAKLVPGETLVVGAAAGPVGATVAQLAKMQGARVVAIAGGERKQSCPSCRSVLRAIPFF